MMGKEEGKRDEASGAEIEGEATLTLPDGEKIHLPYLKACICKAKMTLKLYQMSSMSCMERSLTSKRMPQIAAGFSRQSICGHSKSVQQVYSPFESCCPMSQRKITGRTWRCDHPAGQSCAPLTLVSPQQVTTHNLHNIFVVKLCLHMRQQALCMVAGSCQSQICYIDGQKGVLLYRGYFSALWPSGCHHCLYGSQSTR